MSTFFKELIRGRFLGHPIHVMLVHFPSALFPTALLFDALAHYTQNGLYAFIAFYILGLGVASGVAAACFGAIDYAAIPPQHNAWKTASVHTLLNVLWITIFGTLFGIRMVEYPDIKITTLTQLLMNALTVSGLIFSNYLGGELVFRHHLGSIRSNPDHPS